MVKKIFKKGIYNLKTLGRAFAYRNYRLYFAGHFTSLIGYWMQRVAFEYLIYKVTRSELYIGIVGFTMLVPIFFISPFAGVAADRINRHRMILFTQIMATVQASILAVLALTGTISIWQIIALSVLYGLVRAFDIPARQAFVVHMVERRENLGSAIALNSAMFNLARLVGPALAGLVLGFASDWIRPLVPPGSALVEFSGEGICFIINAVTYLAIIFCLLAMRLPPHKPPALKSHPLKDLKQGIKYAFSSPPIRSILLLLASLAFFGLFYLALLPVVASEELGTVEQLMQQSFGVVKSFEQAFGWLLSGVGIGAIMGAVFIGTRKKVQNLWRIIPVASIIFGGSIAASSFSHNFWITLVLMTLAGFGQMIQFASSNTLLQNIVPDEKRGRVMSLYTIAIVGIVPFGRLVMGTLAEYIGTPLTLRLGGGIAVISALVFGLGVINGLADR
ncbi:MFS transporter [candidate division WOR-3 bacterium]|uniref:MFS transporter n=1 Tax=candidate division WOR-3 bacterium TaxID=2052148 RepID=A0A9D5KB68_UNCW3|nr:MFS transporter [candidate division WOR-3 bacterium]MBD3365678.1 MFS transporter [candidate division WOR-3 bacterium]